MAEQARAEARQRAADNRDWVRESVVEAIEFFKDDKRRYCPACGACNPNPRQDAGCAAWCAAADKCSVGRNALGD